MSEKKTKYLYSVIASHLGSTAHCDRGAIILDEKTRQSDLMYLKEVCKCDFVLKTEAKE